MRNLLDSYKYIIGISGYRRFLSLFLLTIFSGLLDAIGVISIAPFVTVLTGGESLISDQLLSIFFRLFSFDTYYSVLIVGLFVVFLFSISAFIKVHLVRNQVSFVHVLEKNVSVRVLDFFLKGGVKVLNAAGKSSLTKTVLSETEQLMKYAFYPFVMLISSFTLIIFISSTMIFILGIEFVISIAFIFAFYSFIFSSVKKKSKLNSEQRINANSKRFSLLDDISHCYEFIILSNTSRFWTDKFSELQSSFLSAKASLEVVNNLPRYLIEFCLIFFGVSLTLFIYYADGTAVLNVNMISAESLAFLMVAAYKLIPAAQMFFKSLNSLQFGFPIIKKLISHESESIDFYKSHKIKPFDLDPNKNSCIVCSDLSFSYDSNNIVFNELNLSIPEFGFHAITGPSGSGKSTLLGLISGLLQPVDGSINFSVNLFDKNDRLRVSYVPQQPSLISGSVLDNILFGRNLAYTDLTHIKFLLNKVGLTEEFAKMNIDLRSQLTDRGVGLSGGQMQRLSLVRALIDKPRLLILDEPTSGLDDESCCKVLDILIGFSSELCIVVSSHDERLLKRATSVFALTELSRSEYV